MCILILEGVVSVLFCYLMLFIFRVKLCEIFKISVLTLNKFRYLTLKSTTQRKRNKLRNKNIDKLQSYLYFPQ